MRCAIYCRLSREDEERQTESESIQNQKSLLQQYAAEQGWTVHDIYTDEDYSGVDRSRPAFNRMLRDAKQKRFEIVLCKTQSRFTRDMELVERYLHGLFPLWGIRFVAIADHIDTGLDGNKKTRQINGLVNEWYLEDLSENVRMVLDHKRQQGLYIGGFPLYGYRLHPSEKGRLVADPAAAAVVQQIFQWALEGCGKQQIATRLNQQGIPNPSRYKMEQGCAYVNGRMQDMRGCWNRSTVGRILHNEMYVGVMVQGRRKKVSYKSDKLLTVPPEHWFRVDGTHEGIIDRASFDAVQTLLKRRTKSDGKGELHALAGLVHCAICGGPLSKNSYCYRGIRRSYLRCQNRDCPVVAEEQARCAIALDTLLFLVEERVRRYVALWCRNETFVTQRGLAAAQAVQTLEAEGQRLALRLQQRVQALEQLYLDKVSGLLSQTQFQDLAGAFSAETENLRAAIFTCEEARKERLAQLEDSQAAHTVPYPTLPSPLPRRLLTKLVGQIAVWPRDKKKQRQSVEIRWRF